MNGPILTKPTQTLYSKSSKPGIISIPRGVVELRIGGQAQELADSSISPRCSVDGASDVIVGICNPGQSLKVAFLDSYSVNVLGDRMPDLFKDVLYQFSIEKLGVARIHLVTSNKHQLGCLIRQLEEEFKICPDNIYPSSAMDNLIIDANTGDFTHEINGCIGMPSPLGESLVPTRFTLEEVLDRAYKFWSQCREEQQLSEAEVVELSKQHWTCALPEITHHTLFSTDPDFMMCSSVTDKRHNFSRLQKVLDLLKGKPNIAGHVIELDGKKYVTLEAPTGDDPDSKIPSINPHEGLCLGWTRAAHTAENRVLELLDGLHDPFTIAPIEAFIGESATFY